ncbi:MAG: MAPEG family protein [Proteobacteria bacterium]|nr:MAPEG family protein [Pseudomonadota bacterium]
MPETLLPYASSILALGLLGLLYLIQLGVADVVSVRRGHTPGTPIDGGHGDFLFRAARTHANTTESVGAVILVSGFAVLAGGEPAWVNGALWTYLGLRVAYTLAYYLDLRAIRSVAFGLGMLALLVVFGAGALAW